MKAKTINIKPFNLNIEKDILSGSSFIMNFASHNYNIKIHLDRWWIKYIATDLWEYIDKEEKAILDMKNSMKREA